MRSTRFLSIACAALCGLVCSPPVSAEITGEITARLMFPRADVPLRNPVWFGEMPGNPGVFIALEQMDGRVALIKRDGDKWVKSEFLKIDAYSDCCEMGLLGIAFHPEFKTNRKYYLNWNPKSTGAKSTYVDEREAAPDFLKDSGKPPRRLLTVSSTAGNHKGGTIAFGPKDGYLYVGMGDGGANNRTAQDKKELLGKILRLDVNAPDSFRVPPDNPFVGEPGTRGEIWAMGMRNPWKWSLDPLTGELWAGDVGDITREEISLIAKGDNMGWPAWEGTHCFQGPCTEPGFRKPVLDLPRAQSTVIIGGMVFRGNPASPWYGLYFLADIGGKSIWALRHDAGKLVEFKQVGAHPEIISSFGTDAAGNLYGVGHLLGGIYILESPNLQTAVRPGATPRAALPRSIALERGRAWRFPAGRAPASVSILDLRGRAAASLRSRADGSFPGLSLEPGLYLARPAGGAAPVTLVLR